MDSVQPRLPQLQAQPYSLSIPLNGFLKRIDGGERGWHIRSFNSIKWIRIGLVCVDIMTGESFNSIKWIHSTGCF